MINISTSAQICVQVSKEKYMSMDSGLPPGVTMYPYFGQSVLLVAASLNGGNVIDKFIDMFEEFSGFSRDTIWQNLWQKLDQDETPPSKDPVCNATLFGERHNPKGFASIGNLNSGNLSMPALFRSISRGLVKNLHGMMNSEWIVKELGCERIVATGGVVMRNRIVREEIQQTFSNLPVEFKKSSDAAFGAAKYLANLMENN